MNSTPATALVRADDATAYLLGLALFDRDVAERIARTMRPDDFPDSRERQIFVAMVAVLSEGHAPDPATVLAKMPHGAKPRNHLYSLLEARGQKSNVDVYVEIARQASAKRWQLRTAIEICDYVGNANGTPADEIQRHVAEVWAGAPLAQPGSRLSVEGSEATFLDWSTFWKHDPREAADWLLNDVLARGRGHVIYASHKDGKSLFMLWIAGQLATGPEPVVVIYLDYEMTQATCGNG